MYTAQDVIDDISELVRLKGEDYVYAKPGGGCYYVDPESDQPSCLVGRILIKRGAKAADLRAYENEGATRVVGAFLTADPDALDLLERAQDYQDTGTPWGRVLDICKSIVADEDEDE